MKNYRNLKFAVLWYAFWAGATLFGIAMGYAAYYLFPWEVPLSEMNGTHILQSIVAVVCGLISIKVVLATILYQLALFIMSRIK